MAFRGKVEIGECLRGEGGVALIRIDSGACANEAKLRGRVENPSQNGKQRVNEPYEVVARAPSDELK
jgi:hypothetical protein